LELKPQVYNPYTDDGYSMESFLDKNALNASRPVYLCGGWYHDEGRRAKP